MKLVYPTTYHIAKEVVDRLQGLLNNYSFEKAPPTAEILITPITHNGIAGFHLANERENRACNIVGSDVDHGIVVSLGNCQHFDYKTRWASSRVEMQGFSETAHTEAALTALEWLTKSLYT